jgi:hypothetical protein
MVSKSFKRAFRGDQENLQYFDVCLVQVLSRSYGTSNRRAMQNPRIVVRIDDMSSRNAMVHSDKLRFVWVV